jgi:hypothetical protein
MSQKADAAIWKVSMRILTPLLFVCGLAQPATAVDIDKFDGTEQLVVGSTRLLIYNFPTFQCGLRLVFDQDATVRKKDGNIALSVKTIPAEKGECGCKAHTNDFHLYRVRRVKIDKDGFSIPDELVTKGRIGPSNSRTFVVAAINRPERKFDYYINFDCTD